VPRTPFDSRLLGWLISPESLGKIVSETINYQFGFEVSRSWFYQLLSRSITWLVIFGAGTLLAVSCVVIVGPEEQAVITRFGTIVGEGKDRVLGPGLYFKLPWPISAKLSFPTQRVMEISVGSVRSRMKTTDSLLWTTPHGPEKEQWLITAPSAAQSVNGPERGADDNRGLELVGAEIAVQYRVTDLLTYLESADRPASLLALVAEREVSLYFATHDIDMLISRGRVEAGGALHDRIQRRADETGLGVTIVHVGLKSIHPPQEADVAVKFLEQIGALQESQSRIEKAKQEATETYAAVAGSREKALLINGLIGEANALNTEIERLRRDPAATLPAKDAAAKKLESKEREIVAAIADSSGEAAEQIFMARADRWERVNSERGKALKFLADLAAYNNAKKYYAAKIYLDVLVGGMSEARKYVITAQQSAPLRININLADETDFLDGILPKSGGN
jgi:regulator of protease activity HflC (stomatin/prohibitin superfamily)